MLVTSCYLVFSHPVVLSPCPRVSIPSFQTAQELTEDLQIDMDAQELSELLSAEMITDPPPSVGASSTRLSL